MRSVALALLALTLGSGGLRPAAAETPAPPEPPARVLLIGTFHFSNPGKDVVKAEVLDVRTPANQEFLEQFARRVAAFRPTAVLLEYPPDRDASMSESYRSYRAGELELPVNEIYQLGFRIAAASGLDRVRGFDETSVHWAAEPLFAALEQGHAEEKAALDRAIAAATADEQRAQRTLNLAELLARTNDPSRDRINKDFYLLTNAVGAGESFVGADAAASWWHRNFRMFANVQKHATPGTRVVVLAGQGHTAILRDLLAIDRRLVKEPLGPYLAE